MNSARQQDTKSTQTDQLFLNMDDEDFPGSTVEKNLPANAGNTGSIPGPGRFHMPWSN